MLNKSFLSVTPPGPVPAHVNPHVPSQPMSHPQPAHIGPVPAGNPQNQTGQMTPVSGPHPAPSPVQHNAGHGSQQQQQHQGPPQSGTPQPPVNYQQISLQVSCNFYFKHFIHKINLWVGWTEGFENWTYVINVIQYILCWFLYDTPISLV